MRQTTRSAPIWTVCWWFRNYSLLAERAAFRDHRGHIEEPFEDEFARWKHQLENSPFHDPSLWFLALDGEGIVGFAINARATSEDADMGWVHSLGVLRHWRRRGLGLALLLHSLTALRGIGKKRAGLSVDAKSLTGATRLYEKAGMKVTHEIVIFEKELRPGRDLSVQRLAGG